MANSGLGDLIRREMAKHEVTGDALVEGCKEIVAEHEASERASEEKRASDQMRGYVEEARRQARQAQPGNVYDWVKKKSPEG